MRSPASAPPRQSQSGAPVSRRHALREPPTERAAGLPPDPVPRQLNTDRLQARIARPADPLFARRVPTVIRRRRKPEHPANLAPIPELPPDQSLVEHHRRAGRRHALQPHQLAQRARGAPPSRRRLLRFERGDLRQVRRRAWVRASRACTSAGNAAPAQSAPQSTIPRRGGAAARSPTSSRPSAHLIRSAASATQQPAPLPTHVARRFLRHRRHPHLAPHAPLALTDPHQHAHQFQRIEPIRLGPPGPPVHLDTRRIHHPIAHPVRRRRPPSTICSTNGLTSRLDSSAMAASLAACAACR